MVKRARRRTLSTVRAAAARGYASRLVDPDSPVHMHYARISTFGNALIFAQKKHFGAHAILALIFVPWHSFP